MLYLLVLIGFLFFAGLAMTINEGLWSNTILFFCILMSGLAAVLAGVPAGAMILEQLDKDDSFAWYCVFAGVWGVFALTLLVLRIVTDKASGTRVRFFSVVDKIGGMLMGLAVAVMLASFAAYTLLKIPIKTGEWEMQKESASVQSNFQYAATPFNTVVRKFVKAEEIDSEFYK